MDNLKIEIGKYVIVRSARAGVFAGELLELNTQEQTAKVKNARRLWFWSGAASLSQLSLEGVKNPDLCKFPAAVDEVLLFEVIEVLPLTECAKKSIDEVAPWRM